MEILKLLDELEREFADKKGFFSKRIDIDKCSYIVQELIKDIPKVLQEANCIIQQKEEILKNADTVAKHMIHEAEKRAEKSLMSAEVLHRAELEAQKILGKAYNKCDTIAGATQTHLDNVFFEAEKCLLETLKTISDNRARIKERVKGKLQAETDT